MWTMLWKAVGRIVDMANEKRKVQITHMANQQEFQ